MKNRMKINLLEPGDKFYCAEGCQWTIERLQAGMVVWAVRLMDGERRAFPDGCLVEIVEN